MNLKIPRKLIPCACGCGELIEHLDKQSKPRHYKFGHRNRGIAWFRGEKHPNWKGGRRHITTGYMTILDPSHRFAAKNGYVREHHLVWERHHNAVVLSWGVVHHKDGNKLNNLPSNLQGMMKYHHDYLESLKRKRNNKGQFT